MSVKAKIIRLVPIPEPTQVVSRNTKQRIITSFICPPILLNASLGIKFEESYSPEYQLKTMNLLMRSIITHLEKFALCPLIITILLL